MAAQTNSGPVSIETALTLRDLLVIVLIVCLTEYCIENSFDVQPHKSTISPSRQVDLIRSESPRSEGVKLVKIKVLDVASCKGRYPQYLFVC
ncbi:hypothetical protein CEXT_331671 [Caerostris extrusa]|uniref:Uncharacterized protein n=1 Tax=Caerostris extrusa TaxID=172846 RepID=A0AAV4QBL0_CAEEX|nr:hypothetical protein CEXT_331671 [Caerostris extrusa]